jgi:hypothetical protein
METTFTNKPRMTAEEYFRATPETTQPTELLGGFLRPKNGRSRI